ncbi:hypothetical protein KXD40_005137 [Peronospora effusa]|nr:hypothetical protein KXD40_005137 [Peronospora effusa]CAI5700596.1 unnamed protein product [Peronospora effusa]CAI5702256.1 unnamed protein product [Peronospora effusa]
MGNHNVRKDFANSKIAWYVKNSPEAKRLWISGVNVMTLVYDKAHTFWNKDLPSAIFFGSLTKGKKRLKVLTWPGSRS